MLDSRTGLGAEDLSGHFEVRFKQESSAGMAVMREMVSILAQAFLKADPPLLVSDDGTSYRPNPAAMWLRPRAVSEMEGLGRLMGLAVWHNIPMGVPLDKSWMRVLLEGGQEWPGWQGDMVEDDP